MPIYNRYQKLQVYFNCGGEIRYPQVPTYVKGELLSYNQEFDDLDDCMYDNLYCWLIMTVDYDDESTYSCDGTNSLRKEKLQLSKNGGITWADVIPLQYRDGGIYEYGAEICGYFTNVKYQWVDIEVDTSDPSTYQCRNYSMYSLQKKQVSFDNGVIWKDVVPMVTRLHEVYEEKSEICGFVSDIEAELFDNISSSTQYRLAANWTLLDYITTDENSIIKEKLNLYDRNGDEVDTLYSTNEMFEPINGHGYLKEIIKFPSTENVIDMRRMFALNNSLTNLTICSQFDTTNVEYFSYMFYYCQALSDFSFLINWTTSSAFWMNNMFESCESLTNINLSNWNTPKLERIDYIFYDCGFETIDSSSILPPNLTSVIKADYLFANCKDLVSVNLQNIDLSNCGEIQSMFQNCSSLTTVNLSNWDVKNVTDATNMFSGCTNLTEVYLDGWNFCEGLPSDNTDVKEMLPTIKGIFDDCDKLTKLYLRNCNEYTVTTFENYLSSNDTIQIIKE